MPFPWRRAPAPAASGSDAPVRAPLLVLLGVMSCLTPNGSFFATPERIGQALGLSPRRARQELERLCEGAWQGLPLLLSHATEGGMRFFVPSPHLLEARRSVIGPAPAAREIVQAPPDPAVLAEGAQESGSTVREEVVARSRALYARSRQEVERDIEEFLAQGRAGRSLGPVPPQRAKSRLSAEAAPAVAPPAEAVTPEAKRWLLLKRALVEAGVPERRAGDLLDAYPPERIERQLEWLPLRQARSPVAYLLAAIERDYAPPAGHALAKGSLESN